jgi:hypothetical protein
MKKLVLSFVLALATVGSVLWGHAGDEIAVPDPDVSPGRAYFTMQRPPQSILKEAGFLVDAAIDDFVDVSGWRNVAFDRNFFFLGGSGGSLSASLRGGWAGRPGGRYLGVYFSGTVFSGRGIAADRDSPVFQEAVSQSYDEFAVNDNLIVLFGDESLGGLRFDLRFDQAEFSSLTAKDGNVETTATPFVTTLQWGRAFGGFTPKVSAGVSWGGHGTDDEFDHTKLAVKFEAAYGNFGADYQLSIAFDKTVTVSGQDARRDGGVDNLVNLYWTARASLTETLTLTARPRLQFDIYGCENRTSGPGGTVNNGELSYFAVAPILEAALRYRISPKIGVLTGVRFNLLRLEAKTRKKGDAWTDDTGSSWSVSHAAAEGGGVAFELCPSEHFTLEAGIGGIFDFNESGYGLDITNISGGFACIFRL